MNEQDPLRSALELALEHFDTPPHHAITFKRLNAVLRDPLTVSFRWTPVSEGLPEKTPIATEYAVLIQVETGSLVSSAVIRFGQWMSPDDEEMVYHNVTHYATIPLPLIPGGAR